VVDPLDGDIKVGGAGASPQELVDVLTVLLGADSPFAL